MPPGHSVVLRLPAAAPRAAFLDPGSNQSAPELGLARARHLRLVFASVSIAPHLSRGVPLVSSGRVERNPTIGGPGIGKRNETSRKRQRVESATRQVLSAGRFGG